MTDSQSTSIFEKLYHLSIDFQCVANLEGYFVVINPTFTKVLGYSEEYILSHPIVHFIHPDDVERTVAALGQLGQGKEVLFFENRFKDTDGNYHVLSWNSRLDEESNLVFATAREKTSQVLAMTELTQIQKGLDKATILVKTDAKGVITEVNDMFCEITGYSREELIGNTHQMINSGVHPKEFFKDMWKTIASGNIWTGSITNRRKNGDLYYVDTIITPVKDVSDRVVSYIAIRHDVTQQVNTANAYQKMLTVLNETGSIAKVGGWELNIATGKLTWTDETFKILGIKKVLGSTPVLPEGISTFIDEHQPIIEQALAEAIENGTPYALELLAQMPDGETKWVFTNGRPNYKDGKIISLSGTLQDIHDKKLIEFQLEKEKQNAIKNAKFSALGELSAGIAHEINNPLGIISGYTELLQMKAQDGELSQYSNSLDVIMKSCERITHIVQGLKRFSRTDQSVEFKLVRVSSIVKEAVALTRPKLNKDQIRLTIRKRWDSQVNCNEIELEQVFINLINNAADAIKDEPEKWIELEIFEENDRTCVSVMNPGEKISEEVQKNMFEPFFTTKGESEGTGLGLAVVKGIVEDHQAEIWVDDASEFTKFVIAFPEQQG